MLCSVNDQEKLCIETRPIYPLARLDVASRVAEWLGIGFASLGKASEPIAFTHAPCEICECFAAKGFALALRCHLTVRPRESFDTSRPLEKMLSSSVTSVSLSNNLHKAVKMINGERACWRRPCYVQRRHLLGRHRRRCFGARR